MILKFNISLLLFPLLTFSSTSPSPFLINYEAEKFLLWYKDNFKFKFYKDKIKALIFDPKVVRAEIIPSSWFDDEIDHSLFGYYNVFQPIAVKSSNPEDTIIRIPVGSEMTPCEVTESNNNNSIPIFYLKYIDDLGDYSDFKENFGAVLDVALTFTGVGNITKVRHLTKVSVLRRFRLGQTISAVEKAAIMKAVRIAGFATWELFIGTFSAVHNLLTAGCQAYADDPCNPPQEGTPEYDEYVRCQAVQGWLFAIEVLTLSGDLLAKRLVRRASQKLHQNLPNDFPTTERQIIESLADIAGEYNDFLTFLTDNGNTAIRTKVEALTDVDKRYAFLFDFQNAKLGILDDLNLNPQLIDDWADVSHLLSHRKNIRFLFSYRRIMDNNHLLNHVHVGGFEIKIRPGNATIGEPRITGSHNLAYLRNPPPPPLLPGEMSWLIPPPVRYTNPSDPLNSYSIGRIQRNMNDLQDPMTGSDFVNGNGISLANKKGFNCYFPESYSTQRINEEMAYAMSQIDINTPNKIEINSIGEYTFYYYSKATDGHTIELCYLSPNSDILNATLQTIYPQHF